MSKGKAQWEGKTGWNDWKGGKGFKGKDITSFKGKIAKADPGPPRSRARTVSMESDTGMDRSWRNPHEYHDDHDDGAEWH